MRFLIVGATKTENTADLVNEIEKRGHKAFKAAPRSFIFSVDGGKFSASSSGEDLFDFDVCLLRGYNKTLTETRILAESLLAQEKIVIDETVGKDFIPSKLYEASKLSRAGLNYPKTFLPANNSNIRELADKLSFPVIVKPIYGQRGRGIEKIKSEDELKKHLKRQESLCLVQEYLEIDWDIRVLLVGGEVLGAIKRFVIDGDCRSNASLGARAENFPINDEIAEIAKKSTSVMGYEVAGVDLAFINGKWHVIEVNSTPQWQKFKEATGINPAKKIIEYAINKFNERNEQ